MLTNLVPVKLQCSRIADLLSLLKPFFKDTPHYHALSSATGYLFTLCRDLPDTADLPMGELYLSSRLRKILDAFPTKTD